MQLMDNHSRYDLDTLTTIPYTYTHKNRVATQSNQNKFTSFTFSFRNTFGAVQLKITVCLLADRLVDRSVD